MLSSLKELQEKIDSRVMRERVLIFITTLAVLFALWNMTIQSYFDKQLQETQSKIEALGTQGKNLKTQILTITQALVNNPDIAKKNQITQLNADIDNVDKQLQGASQSLIKADELAKALQEVLQKTTQLTLLEVETLPARELQLAQVAGSSEANAAGVYEHSVALHVGGSYFQVIQFLTALEQLPWRFYWQSLDYKVTKYPNAEIILRVYTLSSEEGLLGV